MTDETSEKYKWVDAVVRLIELTREGKLLWKVESEAQTPFDLERASAVFSTEHDRQKLRLYAIKASIGYRMETYQETKTILDVVNEKGERLWSFPDVVALSSLLETVGYQVSGMSSFLKNINRESEAIVNL